MLLAALLKHVASLEKMQQWQEALIEATFHMQIEDQSQKVHILPKEHGKHVVLCSHWQCAL